MPVKSELSNKQSLYEGLKYQGQVSDLAGTLNQLFARIKPDADGNVTIGNEPLLCTIGRKLWEEYSLRYKIGSALGFNQITNTVTFLPEPIGDFLNREPSGPTVVLQPNETVKWDFSQT